MNLSLINEFIRRNFQGFIGFGQVLFGSTTC